MKLLKRLFFLLLIPFILVSCGQKSTQPTLGVVISTLNNPFFVSLNQGIKDEAAKLGYKVVVIDSRNDSSKQLAGVEDLITKGVSAILINPTDSDSVVNAIKQANAQGIPVITMDRGANGGEVVSHIASDNVKGGEMAGDYLAKLLGGKGNVVELQGIVGTSAARDRGQGFEQAIAKTGLKIVAKQSANFDRAQGLKVMENILQAQPSIQAVFAQNDEMALGALKAIEATKRHILIIGFDGTDDGINAVKAGLMTATVAQQPELIGKYAVETAQKVLNKESVEKYIPVPLKLITKETASPAKP